MSSKKEDKKKNYYADALYWDSLLMEYLNHKDILTGKVCRRLAIQYCECFTSSNNNWTYHLENCNYTKIVYRMNDLGLFYLIP